MKVDKYQTCSQDAGFTLIELLVVIVIVGVLGSIVAPGWLGYLNRQRVNTVRTELRSVLKNAQSQAQQKSTNYSVVFGSSVDGPTAALSTTGQTSTNPVNLGSNAKNIQLAAAYGSTASTMSTTDEITFDYRGSISADSVPFVVKVTSDSSAATQKCLIVSSLLGGIVDADGAACDNPDLGL